MQNDFVIIFLFLNFYLNFSKLFIKKLRLKSLKIILLIRYYKTNIHFRKTKIIIIIDLLLIHFGVLFAI